MANLTDGSILDKLDDIEEPSIIRIYSNIIRTKYKRRVLMLILSIWCL